MTERSRVECEGKKGANKKWKRAVIDPPRQFATVHSFVLGNSYFYPLWFFPSSFLLPLFPSLFLLLFPPFLITSPSYFALLVHPSLSPSFSLSLSLSFPSFIPFTYNHGLLWKQTLWSRRGKHPPTSHALSFASYSHTHILSLSPHPCSRAIHSFSSTSHSPTSTHTWSTQKSTHTSLHQQPALACPSKNPFATTPSCLPPLPRLSV